MSAFTAAFRRVQAVSLFFAAAVVAGASLFVWFAGSSQSRTRRRATSATSPRAPSSASRASTACSAGPRRRDARGCCDVDQHQHHAVHLHRGLHRRRRRAQPRQPEDRVPRPHRLARRRRPRAAVHGALQHDGGAATRSRRIRTPSSRWRTRNFVREPLRTFARDEVQRRNGLEVKDALIADRRRGAGAHPDLRRRQPVRDRQRRRRQRPVSGGGRRRGVAQARGHAGTAAQGHRDRDRAEGTHQARGAGAGHRQRDADHPRAAERRCTSSTRRSRRRS